LLDKRFKIFVYVLLLTQSWSSQNSFNSYYQSGILSTGNKIIELEQGKYLLTSYFKDSINAQQGLDLKHLNEQGVVLLRKRYVFQNFDFNSFANNKFQENISSSTMLLTAGSFSNSNSAFIFTAVNKNTLDTIWTRYYSDGIYNYNLNTILKIKKNEFWLFGARGNTNHSSRPYGLKVDSLGNIISYKEYNNLIKYVPKSAFYDSITNRIFITGNNINNSQSHKTFVACMDTIGNIDWNVQVTSEFYQPYFPSIEKRNNSLILSGVQGESEYGNFTQAKLNIVKLNASNGTVIWNKRYFSAFFTNLLTSAIINSDESIVVAGSAGFFNPVVDYNNDGLIFKLSSAGDSIWMQSYGNYSQGVFEGFYDIIKTLDGGYILCGHSNNPANNHSWVVKTDSLGIASGISTAVIDKEQSNNVIAVYPNPVNDALSIQLKSESLLGKVLTLKLYNSMMQLVLEKEVEIAGGKIQLNTSSFSNGMYVLQLEGEKGSASHKLIIQH